MKRLVKKVFKTPGRHCLHFLAILFLVCIGLLQGFSISYAEEDNKLEKENIKDFLIEFGKNLKVEIGAQYRIMYNASNIPGLNQSTFSDPNSHDFFRQRFRISIDLKPLENVGGYTQFEYRNAWGVGSEKEGVAAPSDVAFNRLKARGMRYGYIYYLPGKEERLRAGIVPISDKVGDTLFSADWDFNVGGVEYTGNFSEFEYRLGFVRLVDTLGTDVDRDGSFFIADITAPIDGVTLGGHCYFLDKEKNSGLEGFLGQKAREGWYGFSAAVEFGEVAVNSFAMLNSGRLGDESHSGVALKGEVEIPLPDFSFASGPTLSLLSIFTTGGRGGKANGNTYLTPLGLLGTEGYWQYTHIFSANGPSDVNDLALEIGNSGYGLFTAQSKLDFNITEWLSGRVEGGCFRAVHKRNNSKNMGWEIGGMMIFKLTEFLSLEVGVARAFLGDFFGPDSDDLYQAFSRFQLEF